MSKTAETIPAVKGFDAEFTCSGHRYEVGQTYEIADEPVRCTEHGYHAVIGNPLEVWNYYPVVDVDWHGTLRLTRYAEVRLGGAIDYDPRGQDSKAAAQRITIVAELSLEDFIRRAADWIADQSSAHDVAHTARSDADARITDAADNARIAASGADSRIASSGDATHIAASEHNAQIAASGESARIAARGTAARIAASGSYTQIAAVGDATRIAASGYRARIASTGGRARIAASGDAAQIASSGDAAQIAASGPDVRIVASGINSVIACAGELAKVCLDPGGCAAVAYYDGSRIRFAIAYVGENGIEAGVTYRVDSDGRFVPCADEEVE